VRHNRLLILNGPNLNGYEYAIEALHRVLERRGTRVA
jgi:hypothetical protein